MKRRRARVSRALSRMFELPGEVFGGVSSFTMTSNSELLVCGCIRVEEYEQDIIKLELCDQKLAVIGRDLCLRTFFGDQIQVYGKISEVKLS